MRPSALATALAVLCLCGTAFAGKSRQQKQLQPLSVLAGASNQLAITNLQQELNPYGLAAITFSKGKLQAGNFLTTQWNDANNNPGQGHTILQVTPQGTTSVFATINPLDPRIINNCGSQGVGLTMALVVLSRGYVVVGSTPIAVGQPFAGPGCLILLDAYGNLVYTRAANELTTSGTWTGGGPWAMAAQESNDGSSASLFVSYVLGANPTSTTTLTGAQGGMVVRYRLTVPSGFPSTTGGAAFWGPAPDVIAAGFPTQPGNVGAGAVGPAGLLLGRKTGSSYDNDHDNQPLYISNLLNNSVVVVKKAAQCTSLLLGGRPQCHTQVVVWGQFLNQPIGLAQSPTGTIIGANGGVGTLFEVAPTVGANKQLVAVQVDTTGGTGAGALFSVLFHPLVPHTLFFNDDAANTYNTLSFIPVGSRKLRL